MTAARERLKRRAESRKGCAKNRAFSSIHGVAALLALAGCGSDDDTNPPAKAPLTFDECPIDLPGSTRDRACATLGAAALGLRRTTCTRAARSCSLPATAYTPDVAGRSDILQVVAKTLYGTDTPLLGAPDDAPSAKRVRSAHASDDLDAIAQTLRDRLRRARDELPQFRGAP